jgi:hypothetical protein
MLPASAVPDSVEEGSLVIPPKATSAPAALFFTVATVERALVSNVTAMSGEATPTLSADHLCFPIDMRP